MYNEVLDNVSRKHLEINEYIEQNIKEVCEREKSTMREVFEFIVFV